MSVRKKMAHGAFWSFLEKGGNQLTSFVVFMIIARLVGPEDYGLISLCYIYMGLAVTIFNGLLDGVVSLKIEDPRRLSTLFWTILALGLGFSLAGCGTAYLLDVLFDQARLGSLLTGFSIIPVLLGLSALPASLFAAKMDFRIMAIRTLVATLCGGIVGIFMALHGYGATALVAQQIVNYAVANLILWPSCGWRPKFLFDKASLRTILAPGLKYTGTSFVSYAQDQMPKLFIGSFLGPLAVGYYGFANRITGALREVVFAPLAAVVFPALSMINEDAAQQKKILSELILILGILVFPVVAGAIITAPLYVPVFFGQAWEPAIPVLQLCLLALAVGPFISVLQSIFRARNATGVFLKAHIALVAISLAVSLVITPFGLIPMTLCLTTFYLLSMPLYTIVLMRRLGYNLLPDYKKLWVPLGTTVFMISTIAFIQKSGFLPNPIWLQLMILIVIGGLTYLAATLCMQHKRLMNLFQRMGFRKDMDR